MKTEYQVVEDDGGQTLIAANHRHGPLDVDGCRWAVENEDGWRDGLAPRALVVERPSADGVYDGPTYLPGRTVTLEGIIDAPTVLAMLSAVDRLRALLTARTRTGTLIVSDASDQVQRQTATVRRGGETLIQLLDDYTARWSLVLFAPDPRRYSLDEHSVQTGVYSSGEGRPYPLAYARAYGALGTAGRITVVNAGNTPADLEMAIAGPVTGPRIVHVGSGRSLEFDLDIASGDTLYLSSRDRSVLLNGAASRRNTMTAESRWFTLDPGDNELLYTASGGAGSTLTITWRDTWS